MGRGDFMYKNKTCICNLESQKLTSMFGVYQHTNTPVYDPN